MDTEPLDPNLPESQEPPTPENRLAAHECLINAIEFFQSATNEEADRFLNALTELRNMAGRYPTRYGIIVHARLHWYGCPPMRGATKELADKLGTDERTINRHLNAIMAHPVLSKLVIWRKQH